MYLRPSRVVYIHIAGPWFKSLPDPHHYKITVKRKTMIINCIDGGLVEINIKVGTTYVIATSNQHHNPWAVEVVKVVI
jgi:hypothetical protein